MVAIAVTSLAGASLDVDGDSPSRQPRIGLRGATGGVYVGPIIGGDAIIEGPATPTHATGSAAGGVEDTTGYRESDTYGVTGDNTGMTGAQGGVVEIQTRPTGRTAYNADGIFGGSIPGYAAQRSTQRAAAANGVDVSGGVITGAFIDKRSSLSREALGSNSKTTVDGETVTRAITIPTTSTTADQAAGIVSLVAGDDLLRVDLHADDITGGASGLKGAEIVLFRRGTDTDEDGDFVGHVSADGGTDITDAFVGLLSATTYAFYARFRKADANGKIQVSAWSARNTVATT